MDPRYATYIWLSYGFAALVIVWNLLGPRRVRNQLRQRLSERAEEDRERSEDA